MGFFPLRDPLSFKVFLVDRKFAVEGKCKAVSVRMAASRRLVFGGFGLDDLGNRLDLRDKRVE